MKIDRDLSKQAALALQKQLGKIPFLQLEQIVMPDLNIQEDLLFRMGIKDTSRLLVVKTDNNGQPRSARLATYLLKEQLSKLANAYGVFFAPFITPEAGKICTDAGIGYLDMAGNCLISFETIYIHQTGIPNPAVQKRELRSMYSPKGERILRVLMLNPNRTWKMIQLAQDAEVSLGQVANIKKLLLDREWLQVSQEGVSLANPAALLDEWTGAYKYQRSVIRDYYAMREIPEIERQLAETCRQFGMIFSLTGFSSAARIAPMVRYQKASAYVQGDVDSLINDLGWTEVSSGANVSLLVPYDEGVFFGKSEVDEIWITSALQTYLDLQSVRGRGQEAALVIRKELEKTW